MRSRTVVKNRIQRLKEKEDALKMIRHLESINVVVGGVIIVIQLYTPISSKYVSFFYFKNQARWITSRRYSNPF